MKRFVADSYYEAFLKAQEELGEEMIVVTSRVFQKKTWGGLYSRDMVEITAAVPRQGTVDIPEKIAPPRPVATEEISRHPQLPGIGKGIPTPMPQPVPQANHPPKTARPFPQMTSTPFPAQAPKTAAGAYSKLKTAMGPTETSLRSANSLRSNQAGNEAPQPQLSLEEAQKTAKIQNVLDEILKKKQEIFTPEDGIRPVPFPGGKKAAAQTQSSQYQPEIVQCIEQKMAEMIKMLKDLQGFSNQSLAKPFSSLPEGLDQLNHRLQRMEMPPDLLADVMDILRRDLPPASQNFFSSTKGDVKTWLKKKIRLAPENTYKSPNKPMIIILIGPTGVGKTTTIAKLAASYALNVLDRKKVALFTLDTFRIGAPTQLSQYAQIIEAGMEIIMEPEDIDSALERNADKDVILVDTAGRCQKNTSELQEMKGFLSRFPGSMKFLVLSATQKYIDMLDNVQKFGEIGFDHLIFTKIDETNSIGPLLGLLYKTCLPLAYLTHGQSVPDDFRRANHEFFFSHLFQEDTFSAE